jgi:hypothetical protein
MEMYHDIDSRDSESNFENPYHNPVLVHKQRGRDDEFVDEEDVEDPSQCVIYWNSLPTYDTYINDENLIEVSFLLYGQEVEQKVDNHVFNESLKIEYLNGVFRKLIILISLGLKIFCQTYLKKILTFVLAC